MIIDINIFFKTTFYKMLFEPRLQAGSRSHQYQFGGVLRGFPG